MQWFEVDKNGLAKILARRGKEFVIHELVSNAWDEAATRVDITLERLPGSRKVRLCVSDNNPPGFSDLSHAFKFFAESAKKSEATKRGRWCAGEKYALALAETAEIASTTGTVIFEAAGRRISRKKLLAGSSVTLVLRMTEEEREQCDHAARLLLVPEGRVTTYNGQQLAVRPQIASCEAALPTELADAEGMLRRSTRRTTITVHEVLPGETPMIFELGIPVCESATSWHLNIGQKVPLGQDRDNVPGSFLARVRANVLDLMHSRLDSEQANAPWVREAIHQHGNELDTQTVQAITTLRFGDKRVSYDPSDPEANARAVAAGYNVVHGAQLSGAEWDAVKRAGAILPAGQVTPSPKPYTEGGKPLKLLAPQDWSEDMRGVAELAQRLARRVLGAEITVDVAMDAMWWPAATYAPGRLVFNAGRLGRKWFAGPIDKVLDLVVHEFGHHYEGNHLSSRYYEALSRLGGQIAALALQEPGVFNREPQETTTA
jgi:hypothetical protein